MSICIFWLKEERSVCPRRPDIFRPDWEKGIFGLDNDTRLTAKGFDNAGRHLYINRKPDKELK
jgi:hypothetical protein